MSKIDALCLSHGNEKMGRYVHEQLKTNPDRNLRSRVAHPVAAALGIRALGKTQIMDTYPGNLRGNPDEVAAAMNMVWLGDHAGNEEIIVTDIHNNTITGNNYLGVGVRALKASIGTAYLLGYKVCLVEPGPFFETVPNSVLIEASTSNETEEKAVAERICHGLTRAAFYSIDQLRDIYEEIKDELQFFQRHDIATQPGTYNSSVIVADDPNLLRRLENIPSQYPLTEVQLDAKLRHDLGMQSEGKLCMETWGHDNMSKALPGKGTHKGQPRRAFFGSLLSEISPPTDDGNWVIFKDI